MVSWLQSSTTLLPPPKAQRLLTSWACMRGRARETTTTGLGQRRSPVDCRIGGRKATVWFASRSASKLPIGHRLNPRPFGSPGAIRRLARQFIVAVAHCLATPDYGAGLGWHGHLASGIAWEKRHDALWCIGTRVIWHRQQDSSAPRANAGGNRMQADCDSFLLPADLTRRVSPSPSGAYSECRMATEPVFRFSPAIARILSDTGSA